MIEEPICVVLFCEDGACSVQMPEGLTAEEAEIVAATVVHYVLMMTDGTVRGILEKVECCESQGGPRDVPVPVVIQ